MGQQAGSDVGPAEAGFRMEPRATATERGAAVCLDCIAVVALLVGNEDPIAAVGGRTREALAGCATDRAALLSIVACLGDQIAIVAALAGLHAAVTAHSSGRAASRWLDATDLPHQRGIAARGAAATTGDAHRRGQRAATAAGVSRGIAQVATADKPCARCATGERAGSAAPATATRRSLQCRAAAAGVGSARRGADRAAA